MAETILFPEQEVVFNALFADLFPAAILPQAFTLEIGQKYTVKWGDDVYEDLSVFDVGSDLPGYVAIGNGSGFGFPGNGEPFAILYTTESGGLVHFVSLSDATSQVVAVYQVEDGAEEDETPSGADIALRDRNGKQITYHGINYINLKTRDGGTQGFAAYDPETLVPGNLANGVVVGDVKGALSVPQVVETTIDPDFSAGNMEVVPDNGKVFSKVGILKPANLFPENIAKDVDIAGVVGTLESGGGGAINCVYAAAKQDCAMVYSSGTGSLTVNATIPANAKNILVLAGTKSFSGSTQFNSQAVVTEVTQITNYTQSIAGDNLTIGYTGTWATVSRKYYTASAVLIVCYTV